jgi:dimeric dUTPase (all-alpha-NTP-PPase superfamily)
MSEFLYNIVKKQIELTKKIGVNVQTEDVFERERLSKEMILSMHSELSELLEWTNWKHWKKTRVEYDESRIKEIHKELIDILHFWTNLTILWGLTPAMIVEIFEEKNKENIERQEKGY